MNKAVSSGTNHLINPTKCELSEWLQMLLIRTLKPTTTTTTTTKSLFVHKETERWASEGGVFGGGIWQKNSKGCLQIPAAWRREGKRFCPCVPSLKFPGGTEITKYKQEGEWAENRGKCSERGGVTKRWKVKKFIQSHTLVKLSDTCVCVCCYIPRDAVMISLNCPVICRFPVYTRLSDHSFTLLLQSLYLSLVCSFSPREWNSPFTRISSSLSLSLLESNLSSTRWSLMLSGAGSFRCHAQFLSTPDGKNRLPVCSWLVVTPLDFWVCMEGGQEVENFSPPFPPLHACLHTLPPSSSSHWPLSIVPAGPQRALSANQSGFQWGRRSWVAFYGVERGGGGSWWSWSWGGGLYGLYVTACVFTPTICSPQTHTHKGMQTDTHTGSELLWTSAQSICDTRFLLV